MSEPRTPSLPPTASEPNSLPDHAEVGRALRAFVVGERAYPCVMAKSVFRLGQFEHGVYAGLGAPAAETLGADLAAFLARPEPEHGYRSFLAVFAEPEACLSEADFERQLWETLQALHRLDRAAGRAWDPAVSDDPDSPEFSFSFGGRALYVVGMHPGASRPARRFRWPLLAFNLRSQFDALRREGRYERVRDVIRARDRAFAGSVNPMVTDFGRASEAPQYAGRAVDAEWKCPFRPHR